MIFQPRLIVLALGCLLGATALLAADSPAGAAAPAPAVPKAPTKSRVLIITGDDHNAHDWLACATFARDLLTASGQFNVSVIGTTQILDSADNLRDIDVIYLSMCNVRTPTLSDGAKTNLLNFVKEGRGLVCAHYANGAFTEWTDYRALIGRVWVPKVSGHWKRGPFKAEIVDHDHAITKGLADFEADDELYAKLQGEVPIHVLVQAFSPMTKVNEPLIFLNTYGKGRVFHNAFGHDTRALSNPAIQTMIVRGTAWAAHRAE